MFSTGRNIFACLIIGAWQVAQFHKQTGFMGPEPLEGETIPGFNFLEREWKTVVETDEHVPDVPEVSRGVAVQFKLFIGFSRGLLKGEECFSVGGFEPFFFGA